MIRQFNLSDDARRQVEEIDFLAVLKNRDEDKKIAHFILSNPVEWRNFLDVKFKEKSSNVKPETLAE